MEAMKLTKAIMAGVITAGLTMAGTTAMAAGKNNMEKCYGIAKAGKNDCGGPGTGHTCQGQSKKNNDPNDWKYVKKGTCVQLGGKLKSAYEMKNNQQ